MYQPAGFIFVINYNYLLHKCFFFRIHQFSKKFKRNKNLTQKQINVIE